MNEWEVVLHTATDKVLEALQTASNISFWHLIIRYNYPV